MQVGRQDQRDVAASDWLGAIQTFSGALSYLSCAMQAEFTGVLPAPGRVGQRLGHVDVKVGQAVT